MSLMGRSISHKTPLFRVGFESRDGSLLSHLRIFLPIFWQGPFDLKVARVAGRALGYPPTSEFPQQKQAQLMQCQNLMK